jgi:hypothetical protein
MKLVALALPPKDAAPALKFLCETAGYAPAEARMRLAGEPPLILARLDDAPAEALCGALRKIGLAALTVPGRPPGDADRLVARTLRFTPEAVFFSPRMGAELEVPFAAITALLRGLQVFREQGVRTETERKFSLGKAIITQGFSMTTTEKKEVKFETSIADQFLLIYGGAKPVAVYESEVGFTCLGPDVRPSRIENLNLVSSRIRAKAPGAYFDDRLLRMGHRSLPFDGGRPADVVAELLHQAVDQGLLRAG